MSAALDSPLEALALNYLTYGFLTALNNIWAWIALITAAVSFWRIRALPSSSSSTTDRTTIIILEDASPTSTAPPRLLEEKPAKASTCRVLERQGSTKMKFSLYYKEEAAEEEDLGRDDDDEGGENEECGGGAEGKPDAWSGDWEWEGVVAMRMGDMGWYRWQERRTVLDGRVVRLWEAGRRRRRRHAAAQVVCGGAAW